MTVAWTELEVGHRLALALRCVDAFTREAVSPETLDVRVESFPYLPGIVRAPWLATVGNGVAKLMLSDREIAPVGPLTISVRDRSGRYAAHEPIVVSLPRPLTAHPPLPAASDFLFDAALWPTIAFRSSAMETTVTGSVRSLGALSSVAGLRVFVLRAGDPPGATYAYTDAKGSFLVRLTGPSFAPAIPTPAPGDPWPPPLQSVEVSVRVPPLFAAPIPIVALRRDGSTVTAPFNLDLGRNSLLDVTVA